MMKGYPCHAWTIEDKLLATNDARIFFLEHHGECKDEIINRADEDDSPKAIRSLLTYSKGFVCGCTRGILAIYEKNEDEGPVDKYKKTKIYVLGNELSSIIGLAINITEDLLVAFSDDRQIYLIATGASSKPDEVTAVTLPSFHPSMINGVNVCVRKPLAITCGTDRSVRVWNYLENSCELAKVFSEEVHCCSFHPTGLYILVGFSDRLRMMNLLLEDLKSFVEFPIMGCREVFLPFAKFLV
jgi:WD40 repeat protein